jgi:hypothetical protein
MALLANDAIQLFYLGRVSVFLASCKKWLEVNKSDCLTILFLVDGDAGGAAAGLLPLTAGSHHSEAGHAASFFLVEGAIGGGCNE